MTKDERAVPAAPEPRPYLAATEDAIEQVREKLPDDEVLYDPGKDSLCALRERAVCGRHRPVPEYDPVGGEPPAAALEGL